jgi:hypothetical protein
MKPKSDNLFHFIKSLEVLKLILSSGIHPRYCLEDIEWMGWDDEKYMAFPMSCFCDIPLSRISEHTDFYGNYGIGLTKDWGKKNNLNPVVYSPNEGQIQQLMKNLWDEIDPEINGSADNAYKLWSLLKPITGNMVISGNIVEKEFYQENEWRYVPPGQSIISEDKFDEGKDTANKEMEEHSLQFSPSDIRYIFVKEDADIPELVDFITGNLGLYPLNDLKILQSRIVSLDTLRLDL